MLSRSVNPIRRLATGRAVILSRRGVLSFQLFIALSLCLPALSFSQTPEPSIIKNEDQLIAALQIAAEDGNNPVFRLLNENSSLVTVQLWEKLIKQASTSYYTSGLDQSIVVYKIALDVAGRLSDQRKIAITHYNIGRAYSGSGKADAAIQSYLASKKAFEEAGLRRDLIYILSDLGSLHLYADNYNLAKVYAEESLALSDKLKGGGDPPAAWPDQYGVAGALSVLGAINRRDGDYPKAIDQLQSSIRLYQELDKGSLRFGYYLADNLSELGRVFNTIGENIQALNYLNQALGITKKKLLRGMEAGVLNSIGVLYLEQEDYEKAADHLKQSLQIYQSLENQNEAARVLLNLGVTDQRRAKYDQALESFRKSLEQATPVSNKDVMIAAGEGLGVVYRAKKDYRAALEILDRSMALAKEIKDQTRIAEVLWRKAEAHQDMGDFAEAEKLSEEAHRIAGRLQLPKLLYLTAATLGKAYLSQKKNDLAFQTLSRAIDQVEAMRGQVAGQEQERQLFFENKVSAYHSMIELLASQGRTFEALVYAERAKSRVLLDVVSQGRTAFKQAMTPKEIEEDDRLNQRIVKLNREIREEQIKPSPDEALIGRYRVELDAARVQYSSFQNSLYAAHPGLKIRQGYTPSITQESLNRLINNETAFLEYVLMDNSVYLFVITKMSSRNRPNIALFTIDGAKEEFSGRINELHKILETREPGYIELSQKLYELFVKPAEAALRGKKTLCIIPDGQLWEVSFQALQSPDGRFLIESHAVYYGPSLGVLSEMQKGDSGRENISPLLLALANPFTGKEVIAQLRETRRGENFDPLPESEMEVKAIAQIFGAEGSKTLIGIEADESKFKSLAPKYRTIHFATHGVLDNRHPLYSYLLLAKSASDEDGLLEAREIMNLDLNADLVVLSACDTARGKIGAGEGVIGMAWAFFIAGCRTMVVTQWKVDSKSTSDLMIGLFQSLKDGSSGGKMSRAEALRTAVLNTMKNPKWKHPGYWAGFVVVGAN